jgi:CheY-like chemotaxis protein
VAKLTATCVTVGSGNVAGFVMPTLLLGAFAGHLAAGLAGWNAADHSTQHSTLLCAGIAAAMAATLNCPLGAALLGLELFGLRFAWVSAGAALVAYKLTQDRAVYTLRLGAPRVLVVDDDASLRKIVARVFAHAGYEVAEAGDGGRALEILAGPGDRFDLVILDRQMPAMSGEEVLSRMRSGEPGVSTPVIMLTARSTTRDVVEGLEAGADDYVAKPFNSQELLARAGRLVRRSRSGGGGVFG